MVVHADRSTLRVALPSFLRHRNADQFDLRITSYNVCYTKLLRIYETDGHRLPATYANFLIINGAVLFPVYGVSQDEEAIRVISTLFPDREIIPINSVPLIKQHGSIHCISMQFPEGVLS